VAILSPKRRHKRDPIHVFHKVRAVIALSLLTQPREIVSLTVKKLSSSDFTGCEFQIPQKTRRLISVYASSFIP
jgi:hypothetical protein